MTFRKDAILFAVCFLLISCGQPAAEIIDAATYFPTLEATATSPPQQQTEVASTGADIVLTATPNIAGWILEEELEEWQKPAIDSVVAAYWKALFHPVSGVPDCATAAALINSPDLTMQGRIFNSCAEFAEQNTFVRFLPLHVHAVSYEIMDSIIGERVVLVELDTLVDYQAEVLYYPETGFYRFTNEPHTIFKFFLRIVDGKWWIYASSRESFP